ncbi:Gluconokinase [Hypsizygus marmoreus]|uniref:gluconokinase n=1 Tax=Hypsizygus marmoreus TaxID=39966 RepID=A0A369J401_HYPMA|nr:Gluconokinase [Hypsizygus marmoreus]
MAQPNGTTRDPSSHAPRPVFIVVMGVSGTGKSTLGSALARALELPYVEGDDLHPKSNVAKMSAGEPLTDADREPWLRLIRETAVLMTGGGRLRSRSGDEGGNEENSYDEKEKKDGVEGKAKETEKGEDRRGVVISSSALKRYYRDILRGEGELHMPLEEEREAVPIPGVGTSHSEGSSNSQTTPEVEAEELRTFFVFIEGPGDVLMERMEKRPGHFMKASMLDSQLSTLESPVDEEGVVCVSLQDRTEDQVKIAIEGLRAFDGFDLSPRL